MTVADVVCFISRQLPHRERRSVQCTCMLYFCMPCCYHGLSSTSTLSAQKKYVLFDRSPFHHVETGLFLRAQHQFLTSHNHTYEARRLLQGLW